jgi:nucleoside-diphosphate-sugar epimerase
MAKGLLAHGHDVIALGRRPAAIAGIGHRPWDLEAPPPDLVGMDALVHAAFSHVPGRYRGGEGNDPNGFVRRNLDGTLRLFDAAATVGRIVFLSSRAVYGGYAPGTRLRENMQPLPDTLYGEVKHKAEQALSNLDGPVRVSLRATGVFGPAPQGQNHKWQELFAQFAKGDTLEPRIGTEVHAQDLARAVNLVLTADPGDCSAGLFNVSDFALDRHDLLRSYAELTGTRGQLPPPADASSVSEMSTTRLRALGWRPGGQSAFPARLAEMTCTGSNETVS